MIQTMKRASKAMFCASSANQCSPDELVPQLNERVGVGTEERRAALKGMLLERGWVRSNLSIYSAQASWTMATDEG